MIFFFENHRIGSAEGDAFYLKLKILNKKEYQMIFVQL